MVDVTIIATLRPEILFRTLRSFAKNVVTTRKLRAVLHIDAAPEMELEAVRPIVTQMCRFTQELTRPDQSFVFREFFPIFTFKYPSFARAVKLAWANTKYGYVFHLEDDWEFVRRIDLDLAIDMVESDVSIDYIRFTKRDTPVKSEQLKPSLLPSVWDGDLVRALSAVMVDDKDPEKQLRHGQREEIDMVLPHYFPDFPGGKCVVDIGREWREQHGLEKWNKVMESGEDLSFNGEVTWKKRG